jgi:hypothetical protein
MFTGQFDFHDEASGKYSLMPLYVVYRISPEKDIP